MCTYVAVDIKLKEFIEIDLIAPVFSSLLSSNNTNNFYFNIKSVAIFRQFWQFLTHCAMLSLITVILSFGI